jgi:hypothetical protein
MKINITTLRYSDNDNEKIKFLQKELSITTRNQLLILLVNEKFNSFKKID